MKLPIIPLWLPESIYFVIYLFPTGAEGLLLFKMAAELPWTASIKYLIEKNVSVKKVMSKQNVSEGFRQKVKQFFGVKKGNVITSSVYEGPKPDEFYFHQELLQVSWF